MPLPKGKVRVYKADASGSQQFIGEDWIDHTPKDESVKIKMGNAFDLVGERTQKDFKKLASNLYEVEWEIALRNHKTRGADGHGHRARAGRLAGGRLEPHVREDPGPHAQVPDPRAQGGRDQARLPRPDPLLSAYFLGGRARSGLNRRCGAVGAGRDPDPARDVGRLRAPDPGRPRARLALEAARRLTTRSVRTSSARAVARPAFRPRRSGSAAGHPGARGPSFSGR